MVPAAPRGRASRTPVVPPAQARPQPPPLPPPRDAAARLQARIERELENISSGKSAKPGVYVRPLVLANNNTTPIDALRSWQVFIAGPPGTVFAGGEFECRFNIPSDYPLRPPSVVFLTPVLHCNINVGEVNAATGAVINAGYVCLDTIKHNWSPANTLLTLGACLQQLLEEPIWSDAIGNDATAMYRRSPVEWEQAARKLTADKAPYRHFAGADPFAIATSTSSPAPPRPSRCSRRRYRCTCSWRWGSMGCSRGSSQR